MLLNIRINEKRVNYRGQVNFSLFSMDTSIKPTIFATLKH